MEKFLICWLFIWLCIALLLCCVIIKKQITTIRDQKFQIDANLPIFCNYNEQNKICVEKKQYQIVEVKSKKIVGTRDYHVEYPSTEIECMLYGGLISEIKKDSNAISLKSTYLGEGEIEFEATLLIAVRSDEE